MDDGDFDIHTRILFVFVDPTWSLVETLSRLLYFFLHKCMIAVVK